jgi:hypothetical protein
MVGQTQLHGHRPAGGISMLDDRVGPGTALCVRGEIVWANERLAELVGQGEALTLAGKNLLEFLEDAGEGLPGSQAGDAIACRIRSVGTLVRVSVSAGLASAKQLCECV